MKRMLFIYNNSLDGSYGGAQGTMKALAGLSLFFKLEKYSCIKKPNKIKTLLRNILCYSGNLSSNDCKKIFKMVSTNNYDAVYFDVSLYGRLVKKIKLKYPNLKVIVNYHNFEEKYFYDLYKQNGMLYYPVYKAAIYNERLSSKFADLNIFISEEDKENVHPKNKSIIIPATLKDYFKEIYFDKEPYLLFIGSATSPNIEAAKIIIEEIAPKVDVHFIIAGSGMDKVFFHYDKTKISIFGYVKDFAELLGGASAFVCPLYHGSGAKIKIAEAMMFGKKILATPESFNGYDMNGLMYSICKTSEGFIEEIKKLDISKKYYEENRKKFLEKYADVNLKNYYKPVFEFVESGE